jgi:hypothetical protein
MIIITTTGLFKVQRLVTATSFINFHNSQIKQLVAMKAQRLRYGLEA